MKLIEYAFSQRAQQDFQLAHGREQHKLWLQDLAIPGLNLSLPNCLTEVCSVFYPSAGKCFPLTFFPLQKWSILNKSSLPHKSIWSGSLTQLLKWANILTAKSIRKALGYSVSAKLSTHFFRLSFENAILFICPPKLQSLVLSEATTRGCIDNCLLQRRWYNLTRCSTDVPVVALKIKVYNPGQSHNCCV